MTRTGNEAIIEQFLADGITCMFGNPGTVEQGFLDAVEKFEEMRYVLTLQEGVAVGIADGYARATGGPALVQLHSGVGLGNGIGMMYQAMRGHAPLVVIAGESGVRYDAMDAQMAADLVAMARPVTKYATRVIDPSSVLRVLRRALKIAMTPPRGPVFVSLPLDVLDHPNDEPIVPTSLPMTESLPVPELVDQAAGLLARAERPLVLIGDGVATSGAQSALTRVAEQLGADVWGVDYAEVGIDGRHPLYRGQTGHMFGEVSRAIVRDADAILVVGTYLFPEVFPDLSTPFRADARIVHIDLNAYEIAKNHPVTLGLVADPKATLTAISERLERRLTSADREAAALRLRTLRDRAQGDTTHSLVGEFAARLAAVAPADLMVFDESLTASGAISAHLPPGLPGHWFQTRGGSLGVGIPGAIGMKLAHPDKTVVGFTGDGGSMYTFQALATAVREGVGAKFVICNNRSYRLLDLNIEKYWKERGIPHHAYPRAFDLSDLGLAFVDIARGFGVDGMLVEKPAQLDEALDRMLANDRPFLLDLKSDEGEL
ncbi:thiamine pyrophosphate-binding protein [Nonomuraea sp. NBC_00507]|uniref:thiamine pyrophosphate-binding protein n=1 Tax=Nonomuraea sp. NBC_00507 TaxID=2976002 RepID=UPI002E18F7F7